MLTEIVTGLSAATHATQLVKELRSIDQSLDEAGFKLKLAELTEALADTRVALSEAKLAIVERDEEIAALKHELSAEAKADVCPRCHKGNMEVIKTAPYNVGLAGRNGVQIWNKRCDNKECAHEDKIFHDPNNILKK